MPSNSRRNFGPLPVHPGVFPDPFCSCICCAVVLASTQKSFFHQVLLHLNVNARIRFIDFRKDAVRKVLDRLAFLLSHIRQLTSRCGGVLQLPEPLLQGVSQCSVVILDLAQFLPDEVHCFATQTCQKSVSLVMLIPSIIVRCLGELENE